MEKENVTCEQATFINMDEANKVALKAKAKVKVKEARIGFIVALISTILAIVSFMMEAKGYGGTLTWIMGIASIVGALVSYVLGGGFMIACRYAKKIAVWGWVVVPFPVDIITGIITFILAIAVFFFLPVIFVGMSYTQIKKEYDAANIYIANNV